MHVGAQDAYFPSQSFAQGGEGQSQSHSCWALMTEVVMVMLIVTVMKMKMVFMMMMSMSAPQWAQGRSWPAGWDGSRCRSPTRSAEKKWLRWWWEGWGGRSNQIWWYPNPSTWNQRRCDMLGLILRNYWRGGANYQRSNRMYVMWWCLQYDVFSNSVTLCSRHSN